MNNMHVYSYLTAMTSFPSEKISTDAEERLSAREESSVELDLEERMSEWNRCVSVWRATSEKECTVADKERVRERERERRRRGEEKTTSLFAGRVRIFSERSFINDRMIECGSVACPSSVMWETIKRIIRLLIVSVVEFNLQRMPIDDSVTDTRSSPMALPRPSDILDMHLLVDISWRLENDVLPFLGGYREVKIGRQSYFCSTWKCKAFSCQERLSFSIYCEKRQRRKKNTKQ